MPPMATMAATAAATAHDRHEGPVVTRAADVSAGSGGGRGGRGAAPGGGVGQPPPGGGVPATAAPCSNDAVGELVFGTGSGMVGSLAGGSPADPPGKGVVGASSPDTGTGVVGSSADGSAGASSAGGPATGVVGSSAAGGPSLGAPGSGTGGWSSCIPRSIHIVTGRSLRKRSQSGRYGMANGASFVTVTKSGTEQEGGAAAPADGTRRCRWCGRPFTVVPGPGRPRAYCRRS